MVEQPFQYHGLLNRQSQCCFRELVDPLGRCLEMSPSSPEREDFRSGGSSNTFGHTSVSEEGPHTLLENVRHCVALSVVNCCSHCTNHCATRS